MTEEFEAIKKILLSYANVAVVGISDKPDRPSYQVADYLQGHGYRVLPVNPQLKSVLDKEAYPDLKSIPEPIEIVDIFRRPEHVLPVVEEAIAVGAKVIWMQEGIINESAAQRAREAGLQVVMDKCMLKEHRKLYAD